MNRGRIKLCINIMLARINEVEIEFLRFIHGA